MSATPKDPSLCACPCHGGGAKHIAPCYCSECAYCQRRVRNDQAAEHVKHCGRKKPPRKRRGI